MYCPRRSATRLHSLDIPTLVYLLCHRHSPMCVPVTCISIPFATLNVRGRLSWAHFEVLHPVYGNSTKPHIIEHLFKVTGSFRLKGRFVGTNAVLKFHWHIMRGFRERYGMFDFLRFLDHGGDFDPCCLITVWHAHIWLAASGKSTLLDFENIDSSVW